MNKETFEVVLSGTEECAGKSTMQMEFAVLIYRGEPIAIFFFICYHYCIRNNHLCIKAQNAENRKTGGHSDERQIKAIIFVIKYWEVVLRTAGMHK